MTIRDIQHKLTIHQIFEYTPTTEDAIQFCSTRHPQSFKFDELNRHECSKIFNVSKYVAIEFICYKYEFIPNETLNLLELAYAIHAPGLMYVIRPRSNLGKFVNSKFMVTTGSKYPHQGIGITPSNDMSQGKRFFEITHSSLVKNHLPPPYITNCFKLFDIKFRKQIRLHP